MRCKRIRDEALDRLDLWRAYGANGHGIAITTTWSKKGLADDGFDVLEVKYVDDAELAKHRRRYVRLQRQIEKAIAAKEGDKAARFHKKRMNLEVGFKGTDYESEGELRIVYYAGDKSGDVSQILNFSAEGGRLRAYVTRKVKVGVGQTLSGLYVTIGPRVPEYEASHWKMMADWTVRQLGLSGGRLARQSELTYVG